jgi:hypothetical protein
MEVLPPNNVDIFSDRTTEFFFTSITLAARLQEWYVQEFKKDWDREKMTTWFPFEVNLFSSLIAGRSSAEDQVDCPRNL